MIEKRQVLPGQKKPCGQGDSVMLETGPSWLSQKNPALHGLQSIAPSSSCMIGLELYLLRQVIESFTDTLLLYIEIYLSNKVLNQATLETAQF